MGLKRRRTCSRRRLVVDLSGRTICPNPSRPDGSGRFSFKSRHNLRRVFSDEVEPVQIGRTR